MGCTGEKTYEEAVQYEMKRYLNNFNLQPARKKEITDYINQDSKKKSIALQNYQYLYREEDVKQTVEDYKILIWERFYVGNRPQSEIMIEQYNESQKKKTKKEKKEKKEEKDSDSDNEKDNEIDNNKKDDDKENDAKINNK